jgi:pimeloyl-ACP methyl ester carboxylesterase
MPLSTLSLDASLSQFVPQRALTRGGAVSYRAAGGAPKVTHVLLHGIGSGSGSWLRQLEAASRNPQVRVLAWDAPGYGDSDALAPASPEAGDYAARLWAWLDALDVGAPITLVGHSLGALMAARATVQAPQRVARLVLLAPARGYATATPEERSKRLNDRLNTLAELGPQGIADKRGGAMLSAHAPAELVAYVRGIMAGIRPAGYTQAVHLLVGGHLAADIARVRAAHPAQAFELAVASGHEDTITPPAGCRSVADEAGVPWNDLGAVGHACPLEAAARVNTLLGL